MNHIGMKRQKMLQIILILYIVCLVLMNVVRISGNFFWGDECFSIRLSKESFVGMLSETAADVHPPLYYFILQVFYHLLGGSGTMYHMVSLIPYGLLMLFASIVVQKRFGLIAAAIYVSFASITASALLYNNQVRMYSWSAFFVLMTFYYSYKVLEKNRWKDWMIFVACSLCAGYTHYYALLTVAFYYLAFLILSVFRKRYVKKTLIMSMCTVIGYFPWLFVFIKTFKRTTESWWLQGIPGMRDCLFFFFENSAITIVVILIFVFFILKKCGILNLQSKNIGNIEICTRQPLFFQNICKLSSMDLWIFMGIGSVMGVTVTGEAVSHFVQPVFMVRYLFPLSSVVWLLLGIAVSKLNFKYLWSILLIMLLLITCIPAYTKLYVKENELNRDTANFQQAVRIEAGDMILTDIDHMDWTILDYYYPGAKHQLVSLDDLSTEQMKSDGDVLWIFSSEELTSDEILKIEKNGYICKKYYSGRLGINQQIEVYCVQNE